MHSISILTIGSEVLDGRVQDTNSNFLCKAIANLGVEVSQILSCTDKIEAIKDLIGFAFKTSNILILSGGLGPTSDDLTRESVAEYFGRKIVLNEGALTEMKALYQRRGRDFNPINKKQAFIPEGASIIPNPVGTAPGFMILSENERTIISLPGVPSELKAMFAETVEPFIRSLKGVRPLKVLGMKCFGLPEAVIGAKIESLKLKEEIFVSYRAAFPEVHVALKGESEYTSEYKDVINAIGEEFVFTKDLNENYEELILKLLRLSNSTLTTCESCTGGMLGSIITNISGSSDVYLGSIVSYSNKIKNQILDVPTDLLQTKGAVSHETARIMAESCRHKLGSTYSLSITGIAGPSGGSAEKPVGLFYIGVADEKTSSSHRFFLPLKRPQIRRYACYAALDVLRRHISGISKIPDASIPDVK